MPVDGTQCIWPPLNSLVNWTQSGTHDVCPLCPQVVSDAAGQGVTITGSKTFNNWNWPNAIIFAATVITTIGKYFLYVQQ